MGFGNIPSPTPVPTQPPQDDAFQQQFSGFFDAPDIGQDLIGQRVTIPGGFTFVVEGVRSGQVFGKRSDGVTISHPISQAVLTDQGRLAIINETATVTSSFSASKTDVENYLKTGNVNLAGADAAPSGQLIQVTLPDGTPVPNQFIDETGKKFDLTPPAGPVGPAPPTPFDFASLSLSYTDAINNIMSGQFNAASQEATFDFDFQKFEADLAFNQANLNLTAATELRRDERERQRDEATRQVRVAEEAGRRATTKLDAFSTSTPGLKSFGGIPSNQFTFNSLFDSGPGGAGNLRELQVIPGKSAVMLPDTQLPSAGAPPNFPQAPNFQQPSQGIQQFLSQFGF